MFVAVVVAVAVAAVVGGIGQRSVAEFRPVDPYPVDLYPVDPYPVGLVVEP